MTVEDPVRNHRRSGPPPGRAGRALWRVLQAAAVVVTLLLGVFLTDHLPSTDDTQAPFVVTGTMNHPVTARTFVVTVTGVRGGSTLSDSSGPHPSTGVWLLVTLTAAARTAPTQVSYVVLADREGRTYRATSRVNQPLVGQDVLEPGVPITTEVAFEVPTAVADQVRIELATDGVDQRMDDIAEVPLAVTAAQARDWRAATTPLTLAPEALT